MKKILTLALFCLSFITLRAQNMVAVYGNLSASNGAPVENISVHIQSYGDTINGGGYVHNKTVLTNASGYYLDTIYLPPNLDTGWVSVDINDCKGQNIMKWGTFSNTSGMAAIDFNYCSDTISNPDSSVAFVYVSGVLYSNGAAVNNVPVHLTVSANNGATYQAIDLQTNSQGYYNDTIFFSTSVTYGVVTAEITDCWGNNKSDTRYFSANNNYLNMDFQYCSDTVANPDSSVALVYVHGKLTSTSTSVANVLVHLSATGNNSSSYGKDVLTDSQGYYGDTILLSSGVIWGEVSAEITDCWGNNKSDTRYFSANNNYINIDFNYCADTISNPDSSVKFVYVGGQLFSNGSIASNVVVHISATANNSFTYQKDVMTDGQGHYSDSIFVTPGATWGSLTAAITNCHGFYQSYSNYFSGNNSYLVIDFNYCSDTIVNPDSLHNYVIQGYIGAPDTMYAANKDFTVYLIRTFANNDTLPVVVDTAHASVYYWFNNPGPGNYIVKAAPTKGSALYGKFFPTYYGQTLGWADATIINRPIANSELNNIWMLQADTMQGIGAISGNVYDENGNGIEGVQLILSDENDVLINCATTDAQGKYAFNDIPLQNYKVWGEMLGKQHEIEHVVVNAAAPISEHNDFKVVGDNIMAIQATGIASNNNEINKISIVPNPASSNASLMMYTTQSTKATIIVYSVTGAKIWQQVIDLQSGTQQIELPMHKLEKGVYIIETLTTNTKTINRLVKE